MSWDVLNKLFSRRRLAATQPSEESVTDAWGAPQTYTATRVQLSCGFSSLDQGRVAQGGPVAAGSQRDDAWCTLD